MMLRGIVDLLENSKIYGWAFNTASPQERVRIAIKAGESVIAQGLADVFRKDLPNAKIGDGHHAFEILIPPHVTSFRGLTIIAESSGAESVVLPIETAQDRKINQALGEHRRRHDKALVELKSLFDESNLKSMAVEEEVAARLADLSQRVDEWEARMEANEVFLFRIDETLKSLAAEQGKRKRKRFLGIF